MMDLAPIDLRCEKLDRERHEATLIEFAREFREEGDGRYDLLLSDPDRFFEMVRVFELGRELPPQRVPMSHFVFFEGGSLVGASRIRWKLVPVLLLDGGHIGYEVRRSARGRGIAKEILRRSVAMAREAGISSIVLTAAADNLASLRVIESQGGLFDQETISPRTGQTMRRFLLPTETP